ncbi:hypothetical protein QVD17_00555 [Tagetes erecta]|uniref:Homeobox domain-containing protein n=1 Tax=Tagetes erecta TaxID=13708 RepID=A0AAD8L8V3_TARER|nr:hypothetical protein QVD17_00555 [Tagetes erecta]
MMNQEERCNTTLGLRTGTETGTRTGTETGTRGVGIKKEKQSKKNKIGFWLDLSLQLHPKIIEANDHDHKNDYEKEDHDSSSFKTVDDDDEYTIMIKETISNTNVCNNNNNHGSRKKLKLTTEQTTLLEASFNIRTTLNTGQKQELAKKLNLFPRQIEVWFQNRRARTKLKQIEQECEMLKKCCETLNDENRRLRKELQKVRYCSLKFDHRQAPQPSVPFYIRYPIATTMHITSDKIGNSSEED